MEGTKADVEAHMTDSSTQQAVDTIDLTAEPEDPPAPSQPEQRPKRTRTHLLLDDEDDTDAALPSTSRSASHQVNPCRKAQCAQQKEDLSSAQRSAPAELQEHNQLQRSLQSNLDAVNGLREYACNPELQADSSAPVDDDIQIIADDGAEEDHNLAQHDSHGTVNDHAGCTDDPTPLTADERNDNDDPSGDTISIKLRTRLDGEERYETCLIGMVRLVAEFASSLKMHAS